MKLKDGVSLENVSWRMFYAAIVAEEVYNSMGFPLVITSANDSQHGPKTLHHKGLALDLRTRDMSPGTAQAARDRIANRLGKDYDVVLEKDHIHMEYDPK